MLHSLAEQTDYHLLKLGAGGKRGHTAVRAAERWRPACSTARPQRHLVLRGELTREARETHARWSAVSLTISVSAPAKASAAAGGSAAGSARGSAAGGDWVGLAVGVYTPPPSAPLTELPE